MKSYPTQILLTVTHPRTGRSELRWVDVANPEHEKLVREKFKAARESIAKAREQMAAAVGTDAQRLVVENLATEFTKFQRKPVEA